MNSDEIKIKHIKLKLHFTYCGIIAVAIGICLFTVRNYSNSDMAVQFSFGATLVGIVLSVIAIFMSIMGEKDVSSTKDKLVTVSDDLINITKKLNHSMNSINNVLSMKEEIKLSNQEILNKLNESINFSGNKNDKKLDIVFTYEFFFEGEDDIILKSSLCVLYLHKKSYDKYGKDISVEKYFNRLKELLYIDEDSMIWVIIGLNARFIPMIINSTRFANYIVDKVQIYPEMKKRIDNLVEEDLI